MLIVINKDLIEYEENNELVLINMVENYFHALDAFSTIVWKKVSEYKNFIDVVNFLLENTSGVSVEEISRDLDDFLNNLQKVGIIKIV